MADRKRRALPSRSPAEAAPAVNAPGRASPVLHELVAHMRRERTVLIEDWVSRISTWRILPRFRELEIRAEAGSLYDQFLDALEARGDEELRSHTQRFSERIIGPGGEVHEVLGAVLTLRDVLARSIKFSPGRLEDLSRFLDEYQDAANRVIVTLADEFLHERERIIREQQEAIREQSTPVLQVSGRLLILPIIGLIDPPRANQLVEQLLKAIRANRARVAVLDVTGVPVVDSAVANRLVQAVEACRLLGAEVIVSGLSSEIAQTLVHIGVDLSTMYTVGDLQSGIEEAQRILENAA